MTTVDTIVNSVLYDGYVLYPYRPSPVKSQHPSVRRLWPQAYSAAHPAETSTMEFECLVQGTAAMSIELTTEFLHLMDRRVHAITPRVNEWPARQPTSVREVDAVEVDGHHYCAAQEATEQRLPLPPIWLGELFCSPLTMPFKFGAVSETEPQRNAAGEIVALFTRERRALEGRVRVSCSCVATGVFRLHVKISNMTALAPHDVSAYTAMACALVSCHAVLRVHDGKFISLADPPERLRRAAAACRNADAWPVLMDEDDTLLISPVALHDDPQTLEGVEAHAESAALQPA